MGEDQGESVEVPCPTSSFSARQESRGKFVLCCQLRELPCRHWSPSNSYVIIQLPATCFWHHFPLIVKEAFADAHSTLYKTNQVARRFLGNQGNL